MTASVRASSSDDLNPRPHKRLRHEFLESPNVAPCSGDQSHLHESSSSSLRRLPPATLLLSLPTLLVHPKNHKMHLQSLSYARHALKRCLALPSLEPVEECRAWAGLAELGMMWLDTGAEGLALDEVETALTKALVISQKHPALRLYTPHLTILSARLAQRYQSNSKLAINTLRRMLKLLQGPTTLATPSTSTASNSTPAHIILTLHLELVHSLASAAEDEVPTVPSPTSTTTSGPPSLGKCLTVLNSMAQAQAGPGLTPNLVGLLCAVIKLQLLVRHGVWKAVPEALEQAEKLFGTYDSLSTTSDPAPAFPPASSTQSSSPKAKENRGHPPVPPTLRTHLLVLSVLFHTYAGDAQTATERLSVLHALLDTGVLEVKSNNEEEALEGWDQGVVEIPLQGSAHPVRIRTTPPRVLHALAFLLSAVAKRNAVGRSPKKGVFARAGLELRELVGPFGGKEGTRLARIKADLMGEVVAISIQRSDFPEAQRALDELIAHVRSESLFERYQARIALLHGQMAHARGDVGRARKCYEVAAYVSEVGLGGVGDSGGGLKGKVGPTDEWVGWAARAGIVWVRLGMLRQASQRDQAGKGKEKEGQKARERDKELDALRREGKVLKGECAGRGAALEAIGELLSACLVEEFLGAKQHLHRALSLATRAQDNHLRALVLALSASHYLHTARQHALTMLGTCAQLAAGLGALPKGSGKGREKKGENVPWNGGNAPLGLWVGERLVELKRLGGDMEEAKGQEAVNARLKEAVVGMGINV